MEYIEPVKVTIIVNSQASSFEMQGVIQGSRESFIYVSENTHFKGWFPTGKIDSLEINKAALKFEQVEIIEACEKEIIRLLDR